MKRIIFLFQACFIFLSLSGKDSGYIIRNYSAKEYGGFNQVWCAVQDRDGIMYFGTSTNIFAYDGKVWTPIPVVEGNAIRSMWLGEDGIIYVGSFGSFGYLEKQANGQSVYRALSDQLPEKEKKFTDVWRTYTLNGEVIFQTSQGVFFFKDKKYVASVIPEHSFALSFVCKGRFYLRQRQVGLQEIVQHKLQTVPGGEIFNDSRCLDIIPWKNDELMLLDGDSGFYAFSPVAKTGFRRVRFACDDYLQSAFTLGAKYINDSTIAVSSREGLALIDTKGKLRLTLNVDDGLIDNSVSGVVVDREGQLWLTTGNGISHVFYNSTARYFRSRKSGYEGDANAVIEYKGRIYLGTTSGLYRGITGIDEEFQSFELLGFSQTEIWALKVVGEDLLLATSGGVYLYKEGKPADALTSSFTRDIIFNRDSTAILCSELGGVRMMKKQNEKWETVAFAETPGEQQSMLVAQFNYTSADRIWSKAQSGTIYQFEFSDAHALIRSYGSESGINGVVTMLCIIGDSVCVKTGDRTFVYHHLLDKGDNAKCFAPSPAMDKIIADRMTGIDFTGTEKGKLVRTNNITHVISMRNYGFFKKDVRTGLFHSEFLELSECGSEDFIYSYVDTHGNFWLSYAGMLVHYDVHLPQINHPPFHTLVTRVTVGKDSLLFAGAGKNEEAAAGIAFNQNNIIFRFAAPYFNHEELTLYRYILTGFDKDSSAYTTASEKEYTNLPEGEYVFTVVAVNALGQRGIAGSYRFTILPPWYRTTWAYIAYTILFVLIIFLSIRISAQQLRRQKERLEVVVAERTAEVIQQKSQLESAYKGIKDSIHYAERIQHAILPVHAEMNNAFPDSFVFFRPRDIVSGDFYWLVKRGNLSWLACVDCTGHGVPGAFMSMIGNTLLNEIVLEKNIESPEKILDLLHVRIRQALRQDTGGETRDGMDISLCLINEEARTLSYAGANRALWIIRNNELIVLPPDKRSIGGDNHERTQQPFTLHTFNLQKDDCIYMSSDGYADQFGGPKGKKFMVKKLQALLLKNHKLPMAEQGKIVESAFLEWKGSFDQVDDVLLIGFRNIR